MSENDAPPAEPPSQTIEIPDWVVRKLGEQELRLAASEEENRQLRQTNEQLNSELAQAIQRAAAAPNRAQRRAAGKGAPRPK